MTLRRFVVKIKTRWDEKHIPVQAPSSAEALIQLADRIPPFDLAVVTVVPL